MTEKPKPIGASVLFIPFWSHSKPHTKARLDNQLYKVEFIQPSNWLYSVPNLLVFQHLVTLYLGGLVVRVVSEIE